MSFNQRFPGHGMGMYGNAGGMRSMMGGFMQQQGRGYMGGNMGGNMGGRGRMGGGMGNNGLLPVPGNRQGNMGGRGGMGNRGGMGGMGNRGGQRGGGFSGRGGPRGGGNQQIRPTTPPVKKETETEGEPPAKKQDTKKEEEKKAPETKESPVAAKSSTATPVKADEKKKDDKPSTPSTQSGGATKPPAPLATSTPTSQANSPAPVKASPQSLLDMKTKSPASSGDQSNIPPWKRQHDGSPALNKNQPNSGEKPSSGPAAGNRGGGIAGRGGRGGFYGRQTREAEPAEEATSTDETAVKLDRYNSDLHFQIGQDGYTGEALTNPNGFCFCWGGARGTYGVTKGKICYEVLVSEYLPVDFGDDHQEEHPHVVRVGWSLDSTSFQLGEEPLSYGYGGTGKFSTNCKFSSYGEEYGQGDVILVMVDLEARPPNISYAKNGRWLGVALPLHRWPSGVKEKALFPHVLSKNCRLEVNFGQREPWYPPPPSFTYIDKVPLNIRVRGMLPPAKKADCEMIMMCGLPGTGKTTWALSYSKDHPEKRYNIIGTDSLIDKMKVNGLPRRRNFHGRWDTLISKASACLNKLFQIGGNSTRNLILDQTNVYPNARKRKMRSFEGFQRKVAVLVPDDEEMKRRSEKRTREEGKEIPESAVLEMKANFKLPEESDHFIDEIIWIEHSREAAAPLVDLYNKEGAKKVHPGKIHSAPFTPHDNRSGGGRFDHQGRMGGRPDSRDSNRDRGGSMDRGSDRNQSRDRDDSRDGRNPKPEEHTDPMGRPMMGSDRSRGRGGFDRGRGGRGGFKHPGSDIPQGIESDSGYDSEKSQAGFGGGGWGDRGRAGGFGRGDRGRGGMGGGWGRGGDMESAPWKQQSDVEIEPLFPSAGRGRGGGRGGRSDNQPPWRGQEMEQEKETASLLEPPPEKKAKNEPGAGLAAIKQEYDEQTPAGSIKKPPSLMDTDWSAPQVKDEPKDPAHEQDQRYGYGQGYGSGPGAGAGERHGDRGREMEPNRGFPGWGQSMQHGDDQRPEWGGDQHQNQWGQYEGEQGGPGRQDQFRGGQRNNQGERRAEMEMRDPSFGRGDMDRRYGGQDRPMGDNYGGKDLEENRFGRNRPDSYGGRGMGGNYGGIGPDRDMSGQAGGNQPGDRRPNEGRLGEGRIGDNRPGDGHFGDGRPGDHRLGDGRQSEGQFGDSHQGDGQFGDGRQGDGRFGDRRQGDGRFGDGRQGDGRFGDRRQGEGRFGDGRQGEGRFSEGRQGEGQFGDGREGRFSEGRQGEGRFGDGRQGEGRFGDGRQGDGRSGDGRQGDGRFGDGRQGDGRYGDGRQGDGRFEGRFGEGRQGDGRFGNGRDTGFGQNRPEGSMHGRPGGPPGQYGQDQGRDQGFGNRGNQYGRQPGEMDRQGMDRGRGPFGGPPFGDGRDNKMQQDRNFGGPDSKWGDSSQSGGDWRGGAQQRGPPSGQWGSSKFDDHGTMSSNPSGRSSRWGAEKPSEYGNEQDPNEPPSTSWMGDDHIPSTDEKDSDSSKGQGKQPYGYGYSRDTMEKDSYGQPKNNYGQPKDNYGQPKDNYGQPRDSYGQPRDSYGQPRDSYGMSKDSYGQPKDSYGQPKDNYGQPKDSIGQQRHSYGQPKDSYGQPKDSYDQYKDNYGQSKDSYGQSKDSYGQSKDSYGQPKDSYGQPKDNYGQSKDYDSRDQYWGGGSRWSDQATKDQGYDQGARETSRWGQPGQEPGSRDQQQGKHWEGSWQAPGQSERPTSGADTQSSSYGRTSTTGSQPTSTGYGDSYGREQSWASKPPPPPPPPEKAAETAKAPEMSQANAWSQYGYYGYEDTTPKDPAAAKVDAQQREWADYWRQQEAQSSQSQQAASVESWSTKATTDAKTTETKAGPPPPQQTWEWGPQGWQLTNTTTATTPSVPASSTGSLYQPPPPPPPEDDSLKKRKSRWGTGEADDNKVSTAMTAPATTAHKDAYADYSQYDESAYSAYGMRDAYGMETKTIQSYGSQSPTKAATSTSVPTAASMYEGYGADYSAYSSTAGLATQHLAAQQASAKAVGGVGTGLMGAYPAVDPAPDPGATTAQAKLAGTGLQQLPGATGLAAMGGRSMAAAQALVGAPVMAPMSATSMAPMPVAAPGFMGLYQPTAAAAAYGRGTTLGTAAFTGRMGYQPR